MQQQCYKYLLLRWVVFVLLKISNWYKEGNKDKISV